MANQLKHIHMFDHGKDCSCGMTRSTFDLLQLEKEKVKNELRLLRIPFTSQQEGLKQAANSGVTKPCPKDGGKPMLFAGDGMFDYVIICQSCGFQVAKNSKKATIERWQVATERAKSEE